MKHARQHPPVSPSKGRATASNHPSILKNVKESASISSRISSTDLELAINSSFLEYQFHRSKDF